MTITDFLSLADRMCSLPSSRLRMFRPAPQSERKTRFDGAKIPPFKESRPRSLRTALLLFTHGGLPQVWESHGAWERAAGNQRGGHVS